MRFFSALASTIFLCIVGGWTDAESYLHFKIFAGSMNGNTVLLGLAAMRGSEDRSLYYAAIMAAFVCGIGFARLAIEKGAARPAILLGSALLLAVSGFLIFDRWSVCGMAFALGAQNAAIRQTLGVS